MSAVAAQTLPFETLLSEADGSPFEIINPHGGEFGGFHERAKYMTAIAEKSLAPIEMSDGAEFKRYIKRVPYGVFFVVAPWNYPYMTAINSVAPAVIAGNTVLLKHVSQALLVGVCMPEVLRFNASAIRDRFDAAAAYLGISGGFEGFQTYVDELNASMSIPRTLTELGVKDSDIDTLTEAVLRDPSTGGNPIEMTKENTRALFEAIL